MYRIGEVERKNLENLRKVRAFAILAKGDMPKVAGKEIFIVPSQHDKEKRYTVSHNGGWECTCPDFQKTGIYCKHIQAVQMWLKLRENINADILELKDEMDAKIIRCDRCGSRHVIKRGKRKTKAGIRQRYECKECGRRFTPEPIKHKKADTKLIALCMDLFFKGLSLRKITDTIYQFYGIKIHHETVRRWINTVMSKIKEYVDTQAPEVSDFWHVDEQMIKTKKDEWVWCWNVIDRDTRFILANNITESRYVEDAREVFKKAKNIAKKIPRFITTDGLHAYERAIRKEFPTKTKTVHIRCAGLRKKDNNNLIERYHGTVRERDKVMRALDKIDTAKEMMEYWRIYYNFVRPHSVLDGDTPAFRAGICVGIGRNKWIDLIERSVVSQ
ncbi:MAG TPA: IS6 family transposase [Thermoplasmata archaeon]|nr:IS6 family transposase [Thermoplasmata archaeon]